MCYNAFTEVFNLSICWFVTKKKLCIGTAEKHLGPYLGGL